MNLGWLCQKKVSVDLQGVMEIPDCQEVQVKTKWLTTLCQHTFSGLECIWSRLGIQSLTVTGSKSVQVIQANLDSLDSQANLEPKEILVFLVLVCQDPLVLKVQSIPAI